MGTVASFLPLRMCLYSTFLFHGPSHGPNMGGEHGLDARLSQRDGATTPCPFSLSPKQKHEQFLAGIPSPFPFLACLGVRGEEKAKKGVTNYEYTNKYVQSRLSPPEPCLAWGDTMCGDCVAEKREKERKARCCWMLVLCCLSWCYPPSPSFSYPGEGEGKGKGRGEDLCGLCSCIASGSD